MISLMKNLQKKLRNYYKNNKQEIFFLGLIFFVGFVLRYLSISENKIIFDYDQYEDLYHTKKIIDGDLTIIGRPIYGNPNFHH